ncbi:MAG: flaCE [Phenylobacterium sp.]|nr:flaCE [Phenylobacterium sp.]
MPGTSSESDDADFDSQDQAETFDESMTVGGEGDSPLADDSPLPIGEDMRTFEEMPDGYDVTRAEGDRDDEEALALDADEFDEEAIDDDDLEEDDELDYRAVTEQDEDDLDGQGGESGSGPFNEDALSASDIEGLDEVEDADSVSGGEDDFTNFQARNVGDEDLKRMGYSEDRDGETRAKPDED